MAFASLATIDSAITLGSGRLTQILGLVRLSERSVNWDMHAAQLFCPLFDASELEIGSILLLFFPVQILLALRIVVLLEQSIESL